MVKYARLSPAKSVWKPQSILRPFSNFDFIDRRFPKIDPLRRIMSQIRRLGGATLLIERLDADSAEDLREENEDIHLRYSQFTSNDSRVYRLSFFSKEIVSLHQIGDLSDDDFLGFSIVKCDGVSGIEAVHRIYESVVRRTPYLNSFVRGEPIWTCHVTGHEFHVQGYLYAQQNNMTNVCAHVAIRTAASRFHPNGDMTYREINTLLGIDHVKRKVGGADGGGLDYQEISQAIESAGARCFVGNYTKAPPKGVTALPFQKYLYGSIESGYPAIVFFGTSSGAYHVVPLFGHTFNEDTWVPNAEFSYFRIGAGTRYVPSESWLSAYISHDDNWGSNFCIPRQFLYARLSCTASSGASLCSIQPECVAYIIATLPKVVQVDPIKAEAVGADYLFSMIPDLPHYSEPWETRLSFYARQNLLVLRPILIDFNEYASHMARISDWTRNGIRNNLVHNLRSLSNEKVWMVELSIPELFSANRRKIGEVLLQAEVPGGTSRDFSNFLLARLPGCFALYEGGGPSRPKYRFIPSGTQGHVELYGCEERTV